ncbi:MAG: MerR family DNA-binding transcriptional regulator [Streptosporangiaceae bacterium]
MSAERNVGTGEAAAALDVTRNTLNRWARGGIVTPASTTAGGHRRWNLARLREQIAAHEATRGTLRPEERDDR